jgi:general secretion pathway protein J
MRGLPRGFTLVEALVAIAILALVALLAWRATAAMTDSEVRLTAERAHWQELDAVLTRVEADLRSATPRPARRGASTDAAWSLAPDDAAGNASLVFTRAGPSAIDEPGSAGQRVGYRFRAGHVEALYWPHIDNVDTGAATSYALTDDVAGFRVTALTADNRWSAQWPLPGSTPMPRGVRIELTLADGTTVERLLALQ